MSTTTGKRTAKVKLTLTKRTVETLQPADKPWMAWDDRLIGFGVRVHPSGTKAFVVNSALEAAAGRRATGASPSAAAATWPPRRRAASPRSCWDASPGARTLRKSGRRVAACRPSGRRSRST